MATDNDFRRDMFAEALKVTQEARGAILSMALALYKDLIRDAKVSGSFGSPIASGRFVSSMRVSLNAIDVSVSPPDASYKYPAGNGPRSLPPRTIKNGPISGVQAALLTYKFGDAIFISNSVPYVRRIEIGGHSWQAPGGVFEPTVRRVAVRFERLELGLSTGAQNG